MNSLCNYKKMKGTNMHGCSKISTSSMEHVNIYIFRHMAKRNEDGIQISNRQIILDCLGIGALKIEQRVKVPEKMWRQNQGQSDTI